MRHHLLEDETIYMMFYNKSLRTRNSFETRHPPARRPRHLPRLEHRLHARRSRETSRPSSPSVVDDVAKVLSRYGEAICIRVFGDPVGWVHGHGNAYIRAFAKAADVPVINMEDDMYHPCQGIADLMTMKEKLGSLEGRKIVISWAYSPSPQEAGERAALDDGR